MTTSFVASDEVARIRQRIDHPLLDADGHQLEFVPLLADYVRDIAGKDLAKRFSAIAQRSGSVPQWTDPAAFSPVRVFFIYPARNSLDRMTAALPALLYDRLDELGLDFALLYPTIGLRILSHPDAELRQVGARALNTYNAELFGEYRDRVEPVAVIPTFSPEEAVQALDHAVGELGLKAVVMSGAIPRSKRPDGTDHSWVDSLGHGSNYDYDPLWRRCVELGVTPSFHGAGKGWGSRLSTTNYVFNHLGDFAAGQEAVCRSLLMGGAPRRFPGLRFNFLEGGVSWALQLYRDVLGHYEKRNIEAVRQYDPSLLDVDQCTELFERFAAPSMRPLLPNFLASLAVSAQQAKDDAANLDDFAESMIRSDEDIVEIFTRSFGFGCEADDPLNVLAFDKRVLPGGKPLRAMFGSDIGHWDTTDMRGVVSEAWELVDDNLITEEEFRDFTFGNAVSMLTATNPRFFEGTVIENQVSKLTTVDAG